MQTYPQLLQLAKTAGLATEWVDAFGNPQHVQYETLRNILEALGLPCATPKQCKDSNSALQNDRHRATLLPLMTGEQGSAIRFSSALGFHGLRYRIVLEHGEELQGQFAADNSLPVETKAILQPGYHKLYVADREITLAIAPQQCFGVKDLFNANGSSAADLSSNKSRPNNKSPNNKTPTSKIWGPSVQLYSLRDRNDAGLGTYTALAKLAAQAGKAGASALAISPVHAMFSADTGRFSPYGPSSRALLNAFHIDPAAVNGEQAYLDALATIPGAAALSQQLEDAELIDWQASAGLRLNVLRQLFQAISQSSGPQQAEFNEFKQAGGQLLRQHSVFEALHAAMRAQCGSDDWRVWPAEYQHPESPGVHKFAEDHLQEVDFHAFLQWQAACGLQGAQQAALASGMAIGLISDMAVGADPKGSQAWTRREQFLQGLSVGAPPDLFFGEGQSWGINALSTEGLKRNGFQAYIEMLRSAFQYAGGVRIDHVLGLVRLWLVPEGGSASDGAYLHYPTQDLMRLISLESHRHRSVVIGEDLGTVPPGSRDTFSKAGIMGMNVLWFQREDDASFMPPETWPASSIATSGTHDMATIAGWWKGQDIAIQQFSEEDTQKALAQRARDKRLLLSALGASFGGTQDELCPERSENQFEDQFEVQIDIADVSPATIDRVIDAVLHFVARAPAPLTIIPMEDLLGLTDQPNLPGTIDEHPNWRRRLPDVIERLFERQELQQRFNMLTKSMPPKTQLES